MATTLSFKLVTPVRTVLEEEVEHVTLNTAQGYITILAHHTPLVSIVYPGELIAKKDGKAIPIAVAGGMVEMFDNTLVILADTAEHAADIDIERAEARARELLATLKAEERLDITTYNSLQYILARDRARIAVARKWRT